MNHQPEIFIGLFYGMGALFLVILGYLSAPTGLLLLWPALSLGIVSSGYLSLGPRIFLKKNGRLAFSVRVLLGPFLLSLSGWRLKDRLTGNSHDKVAPGLLLGRLLTHIEAQNLVNNGVTAAIDMTCEHSETKPLRHLHYCNIQVLDLTLPHRELLHEAVTFILKHRQEGLVYVHCARGFRRSAVVTAASLVAEDHRLSVEDACGIVEKARPDVKLHKKERELLQEYRDWLNDREREMRTRQKEA